MKAGEALAYNAVLALVAALLLAAVVPFGSFSLKVPFHYGGDAVLSTALLKAVAEDGPGHLVRIGAPFGSDVVDWSFGMWLPLVFTTAVVRATGAPGLAVNLLWLVSTVLTALTAAWAFSRLGHGRLVAFVFGLACAFLPCGFYRNVDHPELVFPLVPVLALLCLRVCGLAPEVVPGSERWAAWTACLAQGLCYVPYSLFAAFLLMVATAVGWASTTRRDLLRLAAPGLLLLVLGAFVPLLPSLAYWSRHGRNPKLEHKAPADADRFGLELRSMLLPIDDHPLLPLRWAAARVRHAAFPENEENATARLGTLGAVGLACLLGFLVARAGGVAAEDQTLGPPAVLSAAALLLAQAGGLGSLVGVFVRPDLRRFNTIVVFVGFFALHAAAVVVSRALARLPAAWPPWARPALLALVATAMIGDQVPRAYLGRIRWSTAPAFATDAGFVKRLESLLPAGAMVFQLPHASIPVDPDPRRAPDVDPGRAFLHSRRLRWSWGSVLGRNGDWQAETSLLAPAEMARRLALAGFDGIWVDRQAFPDTGPRPWPALESALSAAVGEPPIVSSDGRYAFLRLGALRQRIAAGVEPLAWAASEARRLAGSVVLPRFGPGCSVEQGSLLLPSRVCGAVAWAAFDNDGSTGRRLMLSAGMRAARPGRLRVRVEGHEDTLALAGEVVAYRRELTLAPGGRLRLEMRFEGPCEATSPRPRCVEVLDMKATDAGAGSP
ncbi:MAG TPA: hypothetical protein VEQ10_19955 [Vicinamibacteria bacterium]|nr:hypothetical protein [Vicinamibacteria bacterium]